MPCVKVKNGFKSINQEFCVSDGCVHTYVCASDSRSCRVHICPCDRLFIGRRDKDEAPSRISRHTVTIDHAASGSFGSHCNVTRRQPVTKQKLRLRPAIHHLSSAEGVNLFSVHRLPGFNSKRRCVAILQRRLCVSCSPRMHNYC